MIFSVYIFRLGDSTARALPRTFGFVFMFGFSSFASFSFSTSSTIPSETFGVPDRHEGIYHFLGTSDHNRHDRAWSQGRFSSLVLLARSLNSQIWLFCSFPSRGVPMSEPVKELLRTLGGRQINVLEVMQKQQLEFQRNLATAVRDTRIARDPSLPVLDGDPNHILVMLYRVKHLKPLHRCQVVMCSAPHERQTESMATAILTNARSTLGVIFSS